MPGADMMHIGSRWLVLTVFVLLAAACTGSGPEVEVVGSADGGDRAVDRVGEWTRHTFGTLAADRQIVGTPFGHGVAVLSVEEPGDVRGYLLTADATVQKASLDVATSEFPLVTAITDGPNGLVAIGNDVHRGFRNFVLASPDGVTWTEPSTAGLEVPMDVRDLVATDERYIAVGTLRTAEDPSQGGFVPVVMTSDDGTTWSSAQIPSSEEGWVRSVVSSGAGLYAAGFAGAAPFVWNSTDGGRTWTPVPDAPSADQMVASGETLLAIRSGGEDGGDLALHRSDGGDSWQEVDTGFADGFAFPSFFGDHAGFVMRAAKEYRDASTSPELCYADRDECGPRSSVDDEAVLLSTHGVSWRFLDLDTMTGLFRPISIVRNESGDTVVIGTTKGGKAAAWIWDSTQGEVPTATRSDDVPEYAGPPIIEYGATLEQGTRYAFPLYIHCGMDRLGEFNGVQWQLAESLTVDQPETGAGDPVPDDWPVVGESILGYLTLVTDDRIEYTLQDGEIIGVYEPLPADTEILFCE